MSTRPEDEQALVLVALAVACALVWSQAPDWLAAIAGVASRPAAVTLAVALVIFACGMLAARAVAVRRGLRDRVRFQFVPTPSFDPSDEAIVNFASGLSRSRRALRGVPDAPASAVRVRLDTDRDGRLRHSIEVPAHARAALRTAAGAYGEVELVELPASTDADGDVKHVGLPASIDADGDVKVANLPARAGSNEGAGPGEIGVARAEMVLARSSAEPLRMAGLDPDPLGAFARALQDARPEEGHKIEVCVDLLPVSPAQRRRMRRRLLRQARHSHSAPDPSRGLDELVSGARRRPGPAVPADLVERRSGQRALTSKLGSPEPLFVVQVLVRVVSPIPGVAKARLQGVLAAFDTFAGENHWRVSGVRLLGISFLGSDLPGRRRRFDRRLATGLFAPTRRRVVTASEIAGLLKPPTAKCTGVQVVRSSGLIPLPPPGLPTFHNQPSLLPIGRVRTDRGQRIVGVPLKDTFFSYMAGRSRWGKTETAIVQFLHLARSGNGGFFLDPHEDALNRIKPYLAAAELRDRVVEINLASDADRQPGWNLFAVAGRSPAQAREQVDAVVDAFASTLRWDERNTRALNLTTQAAHALIELGRQLPPELAPTLFQMSTLLSDDDWRAAVLPFTAPATRQFFTDRFPRLADEAITPITNLIDRLHVDPITTALLGSSESSYDVRAAMDRRNVVLACPGSGSTRDRLLANFLVYDVLHAAKTRVDLDPARRRVFYLYLDEVQTYDGATSGNLAALVEETAKYGVRISAFNQNPERLTQPTFNAITTNRSHLTTTAVNAKAAGLLAREFGGVIGAEVISHLARYTAITEITLDGQITQPFEVHGVPVEELFPDAARPDELPALETSIDRRTGRRPVEDTLAALDRLDDQIVDRLRGSQRGRRGRGVGHREIEDSQ